MPATDSLHEGPAAAGALDDLRRLDITELESLVGRKKSWIFQAAKEGRFPAPVVKEPRYTRWQAGDIKSWLAATSARHAAVA